MPTRSSGGARPERGHAPSAISGGDVLEERGEGQRDTLEGDGTGEERCVPDLSGAASEETAELILDRTSLPLRLPLERAERRELTAPLEDVLDARSAQRTDQLTLEIGIADVEAERLELRPCAGRPEADPLQGAPECAGLTLVAEPGHADAG